MDRRSSLPAAVILLALAAGCRSTPPPAKAADNTINPDDPLAATFLMRQGENLVAEGKFADGIAKYDAAAKLQPRNPTVHNLLGLAELQSGDAVKALEQFNQALALAPGYSDARNNRGAAYVRLGQLSLAEADFLAALTDNTYENRAGVFFNLGSLYYGKGNLPAAEENLKRAATAAGPVEAYILLGKVEDRLGKPELAEAALRTAMSRAPERPDAPLALALLLQEQGRSQDARDLFAKIVALAPNSPEAAQARAHLGK
jgi:tetratricopeptide (TPR) repeat protein